MNIYFELIQNSHQTLYGRLSTPKPKGGSDSPTSRLVYATTPVIRMSKYLAKINNKCNFTSFLVVNFIV